MTFKVLFCDACIMASNKFLGVNTSNGWLILVHLQWRVQLESNFGQMEKSVIWICKRGPYCFWILVQKNIWVVESWRLPSFFIRPLILFIHTEMSFSLQSFSLRIIASLVQTQPATLYGVNSRFYLINAPHFLPNKEICAHHLLEHASFFVLKIFVDIHLD